MRRSARERNNVVISGPAGARTIVFAHGYGCSQEAWRLVAPRFADDHRVVLFDHVGAGGADASAYDRGRYDSLHGYARDVLEILAELDAGEVVFVGHSVSAMIGVLAAIEEPTRFAQLILVGPSPRYLDDDDYTGGFTAEQMSGILDAIDADYLGWSAEFAPVIMAHPDRPELGSELTASFCRVDPEIARHFARVTFLSDNRRDLARVVVPTHVIQCSDDIIAPTAVGRFVHAAIADSTFAQLRATGHIPNLSGADELTEEIRRVLV